jgi:hypothetical protein
MIQCAFGGLKLPTPGCYPALAPRSTSQGTCGDSESEDRSPTANSDRSDSSFLRLGGALAFFAPQQRREAAMGIRYDDLDNTTRDLMLEESRLGGHYASPRLTEVGLASWVPLFEQAIQFHNDDWLAQELLRLGYLRDQEQYKTKNGMSWRQINKPHSAQMLAEGEFNRYYLRGLCRRAANENEPDLVIYRGKEVANPRPESDAKIGSSIGVHDLLHVLRSNDFVSVDAAFAVPSGPNSGLTARLPKPATAKS